MIDYNSKTVSELRVLAKEAGMTGYSKMRKADLVSALVEKAKPSWNDKVSGIETFNFDVEEGVDEKLAEPPVYDDDPNAIADLSNNGGAYMSDALAIEIFGQLGDEVPEAPKEEQEGMRKIISGRNINDSTFDVVLSKDIGTIMDREVFHTNKEDDTENGNDFPRSMNRRQRRKMAKIAKIRERNPKANIRKMMARG